MPIRIELLIVKKKLTHHLKCYFMAESEREKNPRNSGVERNNGVVKLTKLLFLMEQISSTIFMSKFVL